ncbi:hypothetical protein [Herbiconiux sp.]|uniref:hypothetical protein n=1 Tax=Herbiconiux sp. TaxID=1871186 RepID=UPI0025B830A4|nr:hypothetical protein [Herbiconiux sp.]
MSLPPLPAQVSAVGRADARRLPPRSWPVWLIFGVLFVPALLSLTLFAGAEDDAAESLAFQQNAVGRSVVLTGEFVGVETNAGLPVNTGQYEVTVPDAAGGAGEIVTVGGDEHWGFPPSEDHPAELSFLIVLDDPPHAVAHGPVGSVAEVTEQTVQSAESGLAVASGVRVAGIVVFWVYLLGLPVLGVLLAVRRRRAKRRAAASIVPAPVI